MPNNEQQGTTYPVYNQYVYKNGIGWVMVGAAGGARIQINDGTTRDLDTLVINKLTKAEFDAITTPNPDQLYLITDDNDYATIEDLPQPSNAAPLKDGTAAAGIAATYSRSDHVHPAEIPAQSGNTGKFLTTNGTAVSWAAVDDTKVTQINNTTGTACPILFGYPTNDVTTTNVVYKAYPDLLYYPEEKNLIVNKVNGIILGAAAGKSIDTLIPQNGTDAFLPTSAAVQQYVNNKVSSLGTVLNYKGTKATIAALPSSGNVTGDVWIVTENNSEHAWNGSAWEELGPTIDLSGYMQKGIDYVTAGRKTNTTAGNGTTAEGNNNTVIGPYSHAEGSNNTIQTQGNNAHVEGTGNLVSKASGHAEGENVQVTGIAAHAEGIGTTASGNGSHAEGYYTLAVAQNAHAEGRMTSATGAQSHAEGFRAVASGDNAHAEGYYTTAQRKSQHVFGEYNILDTTGTGTTRGDYVEIVGNGDSTTRSNARTLDWSGNEVLAGKLTVGADPTAAMDVTTKQYVDAIIVEPEDDENVIELLSECGLGDPISDANGTNALIDDNDTILMGTSDFS